MKRFVEILIDQIVSVPIRVSFLHRVVLDCQFTYCVRDGLIVKDFPE